jgi:hypothetical protein
LFSRDPFQGFPNGSLGQGFHAARHFRGQFLFVVRLPGQLRPHQFQQFRRPGQAAGMVVMMRSVLVFMMSSLIIF